MFGSISTRMAINASALIGERYAACARCANRSPHSQLTSSLQEACSQAWDTLPAQMPYESATAALKAVRFVGALFHDPFHAAAPQQHRVGWSWAPGAMPFAAAVWSIEGAILVSVLIDPDVLVDDFAASAERAAINGWPCRLGTKLLPAPHMPPALPAGHGAVYVFALADVSSAPCGAGTVLKVGRVGARSDARFRSQHYSPHSAGSTLAKSLLTYRIMWPWLGIEHLDERNVKSWMLTNLDRMHIFVPDGHPVVAASLEVYVRARIGSVFEGAASGWNSEPMD